MIAEKNAQEAEPKARIFISYSHKDMAFADRLDGALKARGFEPLIDREEIYAFEDWWKRLQALIIRSDTVVFIVSPDAVASHEARREIEYAASLNKRFAPIVSRRVEDDATPEPLRRLNFIFFDDPVHFEASADQLAEALQTDIGWIRKHTEFGEAAHHWAADGRPGGLLLRSPDLEDGEHWIASRPQNAPAPTDETQAFVAASRRGASRRRDILTGGLAAGLVVAVVLAGFAEQQRRRAQDTLAAATETANSFVFDMAQRFRDTVGIPASLVKDILDRAHALQEQLIKSGQATPELERSEAAALDETVDSLLAIGDTKGALADAAQARQISADLVARNPASTDYQRELSVSYDKVGDVQVEQGNLPAALASYRGSLAIRDRLAKSDPGNAGWQRDLSVSYNKVGGVQVHQDNLPAALASYLASLAIRERLAKSDPGNAGWQRDLSVSYVKVGDVQVAQGNLPEALASYQAGFAIGHRLAKSDPGNAGWQRDLAVSYSKLGDAFAKQSKREDAVQNYRLALAIMERFTAIDATNLQWQVDVIEFNYDLAINGDNSADRFAYVVASLSKLRSERELSAEQAGWLAEAKMRLAKVQTP